jgi:hypothetical protein
MERSRNATLTFLSRLPEREILRARTQGSWSIKDILAHFVAWEAEGTRRLRLIARHQGHRIHFYNDMREADRFNAKAVRNARALSYPALLRHAARMRQRLIEALRGIPPRALKDPSHKFTVVKWLPEFAWTHERAHLKEMRSWWKSKKRKADS